MLSQNFSIYFFIFFWVFFSVKFMIQSENAVHSVLFLILTFVLCAAILILAKLPFLGFMLILIYVGAIAILFLFVIMMLDVPIHTTSKQEFYTFFPLFLVLSFCFFIPTFICIDKSFLTCLVTNSYSTIFYEGLSLDKNFSVQYCNILFKLPSFTLDMILDLDDIEKIGSITYLYYGSLLLIIGFILLIALLGAIILTIQKNNKKISSISRPLSKKVENSFINFRKSIK